MNYLAIPQETNTWLQLHPEVRDALVGRITDFISRKDLHDAIIVGGPLRMAASKRSGVLVIWNVEYAPGLNVDNWVISELSGKFGLCNAAAFIGDVLSRQLIIASQRLQGLKLPDQFIHRNQGNNLHTCVAGGNDFARRRSIAYYEGSVSVATSSRSVVLFVGPNEEVKKLESAFEEMLDELRGRFRELGKVIADAEQVMIEAVQRPALDTSDLSEIVRSILTKRRSNLGPITQIPRLETEVTLEKAFEASDYSFSQWLEPDSPLTSEQREIIEGGIIFEQPLRILGPAGSGKTLLMQLLAVHTLNFFKNYQKSCKILYITHNSAMAANVFERFITLGAGEFMENGSSQTLEVSTLFDFSRNQLGGEEVAVIDKDAQATKQYQQSVVFDFLKKRLESAKLEKDQAPLLSNIGSNDDILKVFSKLVVAEISIAIKGRHLVHDRKRYVESEKPLSRLHAALNSLERGIVFSVFEDYNDEVFEGHGVLDADDLAITLMGRLKTPLWEMKRKSQGVDFLFVDEAQLFNENECRIFGLLTKPPSPNLPVALALDDAQELNGGTTAGWGRAGIGEASNQTLSTVYRSTESILKLAFHVIQQTTDLFTVNFPDFTNAKSIISDSDPRAILPELRTGGAGGKIGVYVAKQVRSLRTGSVRSIAVIVFGSHYWDDVKQALIDDNQPLQEITKRGELLRTDGPLVILTVPEVVGGQEFDAVVAVGLENGMVPPRVDSHAGFNATLEQQSLRAIYLAFTRARFRLVVVISVLGKPSPLLRTAIAAGLLKTN